MAKRAEVYEGLRVSILRERHHLAAVAVAKDVPQEGQQTRIFRGGHGCGKPAHAGDAVTLLQRVRNGPALPLPDRMGVPHLDDVA